MTTYWHNASAMPRVGWSHKVYGQPGAARPLGRPLLLLTGTCERCGQFPHLDPNYHRAGCLVVAAAEHWYR